MTYLEGQFEIEKAYVAYFQARIQSGAYKARVGHAWRGLSTEQTPLTLDEILDDELETMHRHIDRMNELLEAMLPEFEP